MRGIESCEPPEYAAVILPNWSSRSGSLRPGGADVADDRLVRAEDRGEPGQPALDRLDVDDVGLVDPDLRAARRGVVDLHRDHRPLGHRADAGVRVEPRRLVLWWWECCDDDVDPLGEVSEEGGALVLAGWLSLVQAATPSRVAAAAVPTSTRAGRLADVARERRHMWSSFVAGCRTGWLGGRQGVVDVEELRQGAAAGHVQHSRHPPRAQRPRVADRVIVKTPSYENPGGRLAQLGRGVRAQRLRQLGKLGHRPPDRVLRGLPLLVRVTDVQRLLGDRVVAGPPVVRNAAVRRLGDVQQRRRAADELGVHRRLGRVDPGVQPIQPGQGERDPEG